ncbi:MAG: hypothetical protein MHPSP_000151, partial [Paramarteilia canceri]
NYNDVSENISSRRSDLESECQELSYIVGNMIPFDSYAYNDALVIYFIFTIRIL